MRKAVVVFAVLVAGVVALAPAQVPDLLAAYNESVTG